MPSSTAMEKKKKKGKKGPFGRKAVLNALEAGERRGNPGESDVWQVGSQDSLNRMWL